MIKVLFVCHGNICRSAMAEIIFNAEVKARGIDDMFVCDSAATSREEIGNPMYSPAVAELRKHGLSPNGHRARQVVQSDYEKYDYIIGMDNENMHNLSRLWPEDNGKKVNMLLNYAGSRRSVADPWYTGDFYATYRDLVEGINAFLDGVTAKEEL